MAIQVTLHQLREVDRNSPSMTPCSHCQRPTYDGSALDKSLGPVVGYELPEGFTTANRRRYLPVKGKTLILCTQCRFDVYGAY